MFSLSQSPRPINLFFEKFFSVYILDKALKARKDAAQNLFILIVVCHLKVCFYV